MEENIVGEKKSKAGLIVGLSLLGVVIIGIVTLSVLFVPKFLDEGFEGIIHPVSLSKDEQEYYELYYDALEKYVDYDEEEYSYNLDAVNFEEVSAPVMVLNMKHRGSYERWPLDKAIIYYIKNGKLITKEYAAITNIEIMYNTELDEFDYYVYQNINDEQYVYTKLKDIVTESSTPYEVRFGTKDDILTTYKSNGSKVVIQAKDAMFVDSLDNYLDMKKNDYNIYLSDGIKSFKYSLKKVLSSKNRLYLKDLITYNTRQKAYDEIGYYNIEPGQNILDNLRRLHETLHYTDGSVSDRTPVRNSNNSMYNSSSTNTETNTKTETKIETNTNTNTDTNSNTKTETKTVSQCNSGYVYVSDDGKCYSSSDSKPQINECGSNDVEYGSDCYTKADSSLCDGSDEEYVLVNGVCVDKYSVHTKSMECPVGYNILWGPYGNQEFNGDCYKYMNPNY